MSFGDVTAKEMREAVQVFSNFNPQASRFISQHNFKQIHIIAEGSSRHFPAGNLIFQSLGLAGSKLHINSFGGVDALEHNHGDAAVILISNSGRTKEILDAEATLRASGHKHIFAITRDATSTLAERCVGNVYALQCGAEQAVAATKSVVEQALFLQSLLSGTIPNKETGDVVAHILSKKIDGAIIDKLAEAETIYFVGRGDGLGDELALKFSETCKKAVSLSGTGILHGPQETIKNNDVIILLHPPAAHTEKFKQVLVDQAQAHVIAVSDSPTPFMPFAVPSSPKTAQGYIGLAAGWSLLLHLAERLQVDIDRPKRAQKVGYAQ